MLLKDKVAIVTGAAGGLGLAIATSFAEHGCKVVTSDVVDDQGEKAAENLRGQGFDVRYSHCDVTQRNEIQALIELTVKTHGRLDIMMANAGIVSVSDPLDLSEEDYDKVLAVNLKGVFLSGQLAAKQMLTQEADENGSKGNIINMSSANAVSREVCGPQHKACSSSPRSASQRRTKVMCCVSAEWLAQARASCCLVSDAPAPLSTMGSACKHLAAERA